MATSAPTPKQIHSGTLDLGPYRVLGALGRGGTAQVYKAEHRRLGQLRALKVLLPELSEPHVVGRLMTEARAMARLRHPSIVEVFDCDVLGDGTAFIAMEYLRGEAMRAWLDRVGKVPGHSRLAAAMVGVIAEALLFAHEHGVVHRDLKPENVLLIPDVADPRTFSLKILDFGIAKLLREEPLTRTRVGCVVGTPTYMAPEQWQPGSRIDQRTDVYALGCLFFEMLCGRPPFVETDDVGMRRAHLEDAAPKVTTLEPELPAALDPLIARMLAKDPEDRPQGVEVLLRDIEALLGTDRGRFSEMLKQPTGCAVVAHETVTIDPLPPRSATPRRWTTDGPGAAAAFPFSTDAWQGRGDPRRRYTYFAILGALGTMALVGGVLLVARRPPAREAAAAAAAVAPRGVDPKTTGNAQGTAGTAGRESGTVVDRARDRAQQEWREAERAPVGRAERQPEQAVREQAERQRAAREQMLQAEREVRAVRARAVREWEEGERERTRREAARPRAGARADARSPAGPAAGRAVAGGPPAAKGRPAARGASDRGRPGISPPAISLPANSYRKVGD